MANKQIYLLIGCKGSGKSFIGSLFQSEYNIPFIRVEDWAKQVKRGREISDEGYLSDVFKTIENGIRAELKQIDRLVFESTGLTVFFEQMLEKLQSDFQVITIRINAPLAICLERVKKRDQSIHINVSDEQVNQINKAVLDINRTCDFTIDNTNKSLKYIHLEIQRIIDKTRK